MSKASREAFPIEIPGWPDDPAAYLRAAGWTYLPPGERPTPGRCWSDPAAARKPDGTVPVAAVKGRNGRMRAKSQPLVSAAGWACTTEEAVRTQQQRDGHAAGK